jgi:hypothetical protein
MSARKETAEQDAVAETRTVDIIKNRITKEGVSNFVFETPSIYQKMIKDQQIS